MFRDIEIETNEWRVYPKTFLRLLFSFCSRRRQSNRNRSINSSTFVSCLDIINLITAYLCPQFCQTSSSLSGSFSLSSSIFCIWTGAGIPRQPCWRLWQLLITLQGSPWLVFSVSAWGWSELLGPWSGPLVTSAIDYLAPQLWLYPYNKIGFVTNTSSRIANEEFTKNKSQCPKAIRLTFVTVKDNAWRSKNLINKKGRINTARTPLKAMGATWNEMLIWKGKDNKQLTTELSIRRRLDKYLRRALILEGRAGKHGLRAIEITACWLGLASPTYSAYSKKRPRCTLARCLAFGPLEIVLLFYLLFFVVECYVNMNVFVGNSRFLREFMETMWWF